MLNIAICDDMAILREIIEQHINNYKIDVANLPEGLYFVQIVLENGNVETRRFTVAK